MIEDVLGLPGLWGGRALTVNHDEGIERFCYREIVGRSKGWLIVTVQLKLCSEMLCSTDQEADTLSLSLSCFWFAWFPLWCERRRSGRPLSALGAVAPLTDVAKGLPGSSGVAPMAIFTPCSTLPLAGTTRFHWTTVLLGWQNALKIAGVSHSFHIRSSWMQSDFFFFPSLFLPFESVFKNNATSLSALLLLWFAIPLALSLVMTCQSLVTSFYFQVASWRNLPGYPFPFPHIVQCLKYTAFPSEGLFPVWISLGFSSLWLYGPLLWVAEHIL